MYVSGSLNQMQYRLAVIFWPPSIKLFIRGDPQRPYLGSEVIFWSPKSKSFTWRLLTYTLGAVVSGNNFRLGGPKNYQIVNIDNMGNMFFLEQFIYVACLEN